MADRNGTIKRLQDSLKVINGWCCRTDSLDDPIANVERAVEDALELLKESEPVVRCKDCKWWKDYTCENDFVLRQIYDCGCYPDFHTDSEWFCAEGERR